MSNHILNFWLPDDKYQRFWFHSRPDFNHKVKRNFGKLLKELENSSVERLSWMQSSHLKCLALIILFDQLSRHIHGDKRNDKYALEACNYLISKDWDLEISANHRAFALMPLRHAYTATEQIVYLKQTLERINKYPKSDQENIHLHRFYNYTKKLLIKHLISRA